MTIVCESSQNVHWWPSLPKAEVSSLLLFVHIVLFGLLGTLSSFEIWKPSPISTSLAGKLRDKHEASQTLAYFWLC